ncbi:MAG: nucleotide sugar dehydrogenase [Candidatus Ratteibacteria bacterium]|nr:nucleotide sugar dehydrogenase [Candidatus Ratteibacteria bacterium]
MKNKIEKLIKSRKAKIGVIGLGYVGLPLVIRFLEEGFPVFGFDVDKKKIENLNKGKSYIKHIHFGIFKKYRGKFRPTSNMDELVKTDVIIICVPTPLKENRKDPDMKYIQNSVKEIKKRLRKGQLISLESTTYPGTTKELVLPALQSTGLKVGKDFFLVFSPEREDPGNKKYNTKNIPKVVGGITKDCLQLGIQLYSSVVDRVIPVSSAEVAEMTKLLENIYRAVNIALVNELKMVLDKMGIDVWEVIAAAKTKPFGFQAFYPGPGLGGHCIPIDPFYFTWKAKEHGMDTKFIELAGKINTSMPDYVIEKTERALGKKSKKLRGAKILILGVAYKQDTDDDRESPAYEIMDLLSKKGAEIFYNDPYIPHLKKSRKYDFKLFSVPLANKFLGKMDAVILVTAHHNFDYRKILKYSKLIIDTRGIYEGINKKIVKA